MALQIYPGENLMIRLNLIKKDGTPLVISTDLNSCTISLKQNGRVIETYTYPTPANDYLRVGETTSQMELEITSAITAPLTKGALSIFVEVNADDTDFDEALTQDKKSDMLIATVR